MLLVTGRVNHLETGVWLAQEKVCLLSCHSLAVAGHRTDVEAPDRSNKASISRSEVSDRHSEWPSDQFLIIIVSVIISDLSFSWQSNWISADHNWTSRERRRNHMKAPPAVSLAATEAASCTSIVPELTQPTLESDAVCDIYNLKREIFF